MIDTIQINKYLETYPNSTLVEYRNHLNNKRVEGMKAIRLQEEERKKFIESQKGKYFLYKGGYYIYIFQVGSNFYYEIEEEEDSQEYKVSIISGNLNNNIKSSKEITKEQFESYENCILKIKDIFEDAFSI